MNNDVVDKLLRARQVATPLMAITTSDPALLVERVLERINGDKTPVVRWSLASGFYGANPLGAAALEAVCGSLGAAAGIVEPLRPNEAGQTFAQVVRDLPERTVVFAETLDACVSEQGAVGVAAAQMVRELRDPLKHGGKKCLVLLCPAVSLPPLLQNDVVVLDEPRPTREALAAIVAGVYESFGAPPPDPAVVQKAADALAGLSAFMAEQAAFISMGRSELGVYTMDLQSLWAQKRQMINSRPGLRVLRTDETFATLGGLDNIKEFTELILRGRRAPRALVVIDEIEKMVAGQGDTSGVSQRMLGKFLTWMQKPERPATGMLMVGPPGTGKSAVARAAGNTFGVPVVELDLGTTMGSLVGQSENQLTENLAVIDAISEGEVLVVATSNNVGLLPPELRSRFTLGTYFFDLPSEDERATIWPIWRERFSVPEDDPLPENAGWTGREVRQCCDIADRLSQTDKQYPLGAAGQYVVSVNTVAADQVEALRREAERAGFISATFPGPYRRQAAAPPALAAAAKGRRVVVED